jgi:release factor glutamine methyltransferase
MRHVLGATRQSLLARLQEDLDAESQAEFESLIDRRLAHEPTAYITGHREFYNLDFACSPAALIPRPETELLVETAIERIEGRDSPTNEVRAVDVGTGSGAIAIALAKHITGLRIVATDVSVDALALAQRNAATHGVSEQVEFLEGSLLQPVDGVLDLIIANLPYIPSRTYNALPTEIREHEPESALRAGRRGTAVIQELLKQAEGRLARGGLLLAEHAWNQGRSLRRAAADHFPTAEIETRRDLAGHERMLAVRT